MFPGLPPAITILAIINTLMLSLSQKKGFLKSSTFRTSVSWKWDLWVKSNSSYPLYEEEDEELLQEPLIPFLLMHEDIPFCTTHIKAYWGKSGEGDFFPPSNLQPFSPVLHQFVAPYCHYPNVQWFCCLTVPLGKNIGRQGFCKVLLVEVIRWHLPNKHMERKGNLECSLVRTVGDLTQNRAICNYLFAFWEEGIGILF